MAPEIDLKTYIEELRKNMNLKVRDEIIEKDLLLTLILAEFEKNNLGENLIFKGGTLLSRNYLKYHRFSEDLDFVHKDSWQLRELTRNKRERKIKEFIELFAPKLKKVADSLGLEFDIDRSNKKFCTIIHGRAVYTFRIYYSKNQYIKVEINFVEKLINPPIETSIKAITDFFDSRELMLILGLSINNFNVLSYSLQEIILEKYRAVLTRKKLQERDLFDLFLIKGSLEADIKKIVEKIRNSSLIKRELNNLIKEKLNLLEEGKFFNSDEKIEELAVFGHNKEGFEKFKEKIKPILVKICREFLSTLF